ncbi:hypothetical protein [Neorickettsia findlayensis]|uniref:Uncharacterized protein n=1 Tax=Neorickettsia findlayensis TaxID=2686014 RepID=A0A6P1G951_9RICK|nr:hypothetical protein [Neorickettsia findlayensis]QHD64885.1 hypothetical protein GP480_00090 [Neorickettsia findlayensis]
MHSRRIVSHRNIYNIVKNCSDFYIRAEGFNPFKTIYWLCIIIIATFFLLYCTSGMLTADPSKYSLDNLAVSMIVIGAIFMFLVATATYLICKTQRMLVITEFQNLLFASAMRKDTIFYAIISKDSVLYMDAPCMERVGKDWRTISIEKFFQRLNLDHEQSSGYVESLSLNKEFSAIFSKEKEAIEITLTPLDRPIGFFAVSAREKG